MVIVFFGKLIVTYLVKKFPGFCNPTAHNTL